jgi:hypothetical protein
MDYKAEQDQELESLSFIYPEELQIISETEFRIHVKLDDPDIPLEENNELFSILIQFGETYPEEILDFEIESEYLREEEIEEISQKARDQLQEFLGIAMVFTLVSMVKEEAESTIKERNAREELERETEKLRLEEIEEKKYQGTKVTPEIFKEWQKKFLKEAKEAQKQGKLIPAFEACLAVERMTSNQSGGKSTGKQLFERDQTLLESDEKYMEEGQDVEVRVDEFQKEQEEEENQVLANLTED